MRYVSSKNLNGRGAIRRFGRSQITNLSFSSGVIDQNCDSLPLSVPVKRGNLVIVQALLQESKGNTTGNVQLSVNGNISGIGDVLNAYGGMVSITSGVGFSAVVFSSYTASSNAIVDFRCRVTTIGSSLATSGNGLNFNVTVFPNL